MPKFSRVIVFGLGAAADAGVEGVDGGELVRR